MKTWIFLISLLSINSEAENLGRLFTTPVERAILDSARSRGQMPSAIVEKAPEMNQTRLDGYVVRKSGKNTAWINQTMHSEKEIQVIQLPHHLPAIFLSGKRIMGGVGDTVDERSGKVRSVVDF